jgi:hypothetical protein
LWNGGSLHQFFLSALRNITSQRDQDFDSSILLGAKDASAAGLHAGRSTSMPCPVSSLAAEPRERAMWSHDLYEPAAAKRFRPDLV